jgi:hypothetical protein
MKEEDGVEAEASRSETEQSRQNRPAGMTDLLVVVVTESGRSMAEFSSSSFCRHRELT